MNINVLKIFKYAWVFYRANTVDDLLQAYYVPGKYR